MSGPGLGSRVKKLFMKQLWRFQQSQMIIGIIFWAATLTGTYYAFVDWRLRQWFHIQNDTQGVLLLFAMIAFSILIFGFLYDAIFKMWKEHMVVTQERNPYAREKLSCKEVLTWNFILVPILEAQRRILTNEGREDDSTAIENMHKSQRIVNNMIIKNLQEDKVLVQHVKGTLESLQEDRSAEFDELVWGRSKANADN